jgi:hypothetical protein
VRGITFCADARFDLKLDQALISERGLAEVFEHMNIERVGLKTEMWQWRRTGNIAIGYQCDGQASGIAVTQADCRVHELRSDSGETICYLMLPVEQLKELARRAIHAGRTPGTAAASRSP